MFLSARVFFTLLFLASSATAAPEQLRFQGTISGLVGVGVVDGAYTFRAAVYDTAVGGTAVYSQQVTAQVSAGAYTLVLAPTNPGDLEAAFEDSPRFLEITVLNAPNGDPINQTLLPRQEIASVPFAFRAGSGGDQELPPGAIILWMNGPTCPEGYAEVEALRNLLIRGADIAGADPAIPDAPGEVCPGGTGCGASPESYDDTLQVEEMPAHSHDLPLSQQCSRDSNTRLSHEDDCRSEFDPLPSEQSGGSQPHYHPFAAVLFCQKTAEAP